MFLAKLCEDILRQKCKKVINKRLDYSSHVKKFRRDKQAHAFQSTNAIAQQKPYIKGGNDARPRCFPFESCVKRLPSVKQHVPCFEISFFCWFVPLDDG